MSLWKLTCDIAILHTYGLVGISLQQAVEYVEFLSTPCMAKWVIAMSGNHIVAPHERITLKLFFLRNSMVYTKMTKNRQKMACDDQ